MKKKESVTSSFFDTSIELSNAKGEPFEIPLGGAIGLLALGDVGTIAWRKSILESHQPAPRARAFAEYRKNDQ